MRGILTEDLSEYADYKLGMEIKVWFDQKPEDNYLNFIAEL